MSAADLLLATEIAAAADATDSELASAGGVSPAMVRGDPRLATFDGLNYDFHGVGEYVLFEHHATDLTVQMRTIPALRNMSSVGAIVVATGEHVFEFRADSSLLVDGELFTVDDPHWYFGDGVFLSYLNGRYQLLTAFDENANQALIEWVPMPGARGDFQVSVPQSWAGELTGMLGDFDGNPGNDLRTANGEDITGDVRFGVTDQVLRQRLYGMFGDSWRVTDTTSLFTYPEGQSTASYTDASYPRQIQKLGDLSAQQREMARDVCVAAGVTEGVAMNDCIMDVGLSSDHSFATSLAANETFGVSLDDAVLGDTPLTVGFAGEVPQNFFPTVTRSLPDGTNYASARGADGYHFYLNQLPDHQALMVQAELLFTEPPALGSLQLVLDGKTTTGVIVADSARELVYDTGTLYAVTVAFEAAHIRRDVTARIRAVINQSKWLGVTELTVSADGLPYQAHELTLEPGIEIVPNTLTPGSAVLSGPGATERFCFTLDEGASLVVSVPNLPRSLGWQLWSPEDEFPSQFGSWEGTGARRFDGLSGRVCMELWSNSGEFHVMWALPIAFLVVPAAESYPHILSSTLPASERQLAEGATRLESRAAVDEYPFTVTDAPQRVMMHWLESKGERRTQLRNAKLEIIGSDGAVWSVRDTGGGYPTFDGILQPGNYVFRVSVPFTASSTAAGNYDFVLTSEQAGWVAAGELPVMSDRFVSVINKLPTAAASNIQRFTVGGGKEIWATTAQRAPRRAAAMDAARCAAAGG